MIRAVFAAVLALALPAQAEIPIKEVTSPGGITAWLVEDHNIPFTALEIQFKGGTSLEAPEKRGVINLMTATLEEGAGEMDSRGFAEARDALAASFRFDAGTDSVGVSAQFLTENRDQAIDLLREALVNPRFDQDAVDRVREQVLSNLRSNEKDPGTIASERFDAMTWWRRTRPRWPATGCLSLPQATSRRKSLGCFWTGFWATFPQPARRSQPLRPGF